MRITLALLTAFATFSSPVAHAYSAHDAEQQFTSKSASSTSCHSFFACPVEYTIESVKAHPYIAAGTVLVAVAIPVGICVFGGTATAITVAAGTVATQSTIQRLAAKGIAKDPSMIATGFHSTVAGD